MTDTTMADRTEQSIIEACLVNSSHSSGKIVGRKTRASKPKETSLIDFDMIPQKLYFKDKPVANWTKVDLRHYFEHLYLITFGSRPIYKLPFFYKATNAVSDNIAKALNLSDVPSQTMKEFYDYYFAEHIRDSVQKIGFFKLDWMGKAFVVEKFAKMYGPAIPVVHPVATPAPAAEMKTASFVDDLEKKASISFQGLIVSYGIVIAVNWVIETKSVSVEKAVSAVERAAIKSVQSDRRFWLNIVSATERYGPYPKWLAWKDANVVTAAVETAVGTKLERIQVKTCDDNQSLGFLKTK